LAPQLRHFGDRPVPGVLSKDGGVTVSTGSIAAWEACRGVGTRNRLQN
jgi:hypothetical protein